MLNAIGRLNKRSAAPKKGHDCRLVNENTLGALAPGSPRELR